jgi:hypothetical protein
MDVGCPTFNTVLNLVALHPEETVLDFLNNMQRDQANLTKYASVLWPEVLPRIGCTADVLSSVTESLIFNWMPGLGAMGAKLEFQNMTIKQVHIRTKLGMLANARISGDGKNMVICFRVRWRICPRFGLRGLARSGNDCVFGFLRRSRGIDLWVSLLRLFGRDYVGCWVVCALICWQFVS